MTKLIKLLLISTLSIFLFVACDDAAAIDNNDNSTQSQQEEQEQEEDKDKEEEQEEEEDKEEEPQEEENNYEGAKYATLDFGDNNLVSSKTEDQSAKLQAILDQYSAEGGGYLIIPKGDYAFIKVYMRSNVHLRIEEGSMLYPYYSESLARYTNGQLPIGDMLIFSPSSSTTSVDYIENCSIASLYGGKYTVDFTGVEYGVLQQVRFVVCRMVRDFQISDVNVEDNATKYCAIIFSPSMDQDCADWEISRPTDGVIKNCSIFNAASGYGLMQFHGALRLQFDNLYSEGGVAFRLEPDITGDTNGIYDLTATNISSKNSRAAVMFSPHTAKNGTITIDGVVAESCSVGVLINAGFIDSDNIDNPDATVGYYANDSTVTNIHVIYGTEAQSDAQQIYAMTPDDDKYALFEHIYYGDSTSTTTYIGPSLAVVFDATNYYEPSDDNPGYLVTCTNITSEGFADHQDCVLYNWEISDRENSKWAIINALPCNQ